MICCWFKQPVESKVEKCKYPRDQDRKYIDELITKQAAEVNELKNEVRNLKCNHREEITELEKQTTLKERQFIQTIATLEAELKTKEERYDNQVKLSTHKTSARGILLQAVSMQ